MLCWCWAVSSVGTSSAGIRAISAIRTALGVSVAIPVLTLESELRSITRAIVKARVLLIVFGLRRHSLIVSKEDVSSVSFGSALMVSQRVIGFSITIGPKVAVLSMLWLIFIAFLWQTFCEQNLFLQIKHFK